MQETLDDYGLKCVKFIVSAIDIDDDELRRKYDEIGMDAIAKLRTAQADKAVIGVLGDDWARLQAANILGSIANNPGAGGIPAAGAGLGMGLGAAGVFGSMTQQMFAPMNHAFPQQPQSSAPHNTEPPQDPIEVLAKLKKMLDAGLIEQSEYDAKKAEILSRM